MKKAAIILCTAIASLGMEAAGAAAAETPLSIKSLKQIYSGKTWFWSDGAAYFHPNGKFYAYTGKGASANYIEGGWGAYKNGKICFSGTWRSSKGVGFDSSCFLHKADGAAISQRRNPVGEWYTFKHSQAKKGDEYLKLVKGDWATSQVRKAKRSQKRV